MEKTFCPDCKGILEPTFRFCPSCGLNLKDAGLSLEKQIMVYLLSIFLPPLGLFPGIKYLRRDDPHSKHVGMAAILLTIASCIISIWLYVGFINQVNSTLNQQINLQNLGY